MEISFKLFLKKFWKCYKFVLNATIFSQNSPIYLYSNFL